MMGKAGVNLKRGKQLVCEKEVAEVICAPLHFKTVLEM